MLHNYILQYRETSNFEVAPPSPNPPTGPAPAPTSSGNPGAATDQAFQVGNFFSADIEAERKQMAKSRTDPIETLYNSML